MTIINPFPRQLTDDALRAQYDALRVLDHPRLTDLLDLSATIAEMIYRKVQDPGGFAKLVSAVSADPVYSSY